MTAFGRVMQGSISGRNPDITYHTVHASHALGRLLPALGFASSRLASHPILVLQAAWIRPSEPRHLTCIMHGNIVWLHVLGVQVKAVSGICSPSLLMHWMQVTITMRLGMLWKDQ